MLHSFLKELFIYNTLLSMSSYNLKYPPTYFILAHNYPTLE